ncbi:hypothetical protein DASC09_051560 [Saccharomycopsis crataegensis]|uniref:Uncharacterized protein n=1 Tax=Saccharomycopsis crataegensis TaxID=43959 RepID=A0AAV5QTE3_9ASCO|nr:hypothetical protein DASC09_051560 [Saccharomycopsis crataegensis]
MNGYHSFSPLINLGHHQLTNQSTIPLYELARATMKFKKLFKGKKPSTSEVGDIVLKANSTQSVTIHPQYTPNSPESISTADEFEFETHSQIESSSSLEEISDEEFIGQGFELVTKKNDFQYSIKPSLKIDTTVAETFAKNLEHEKSLDHHDYSFKKFEASNDNFVSIGIKMTPSTKVAFFEPTKTFDKSGTRNSHRFSNINPNYKIQRLPIETIELLTNTFNEYIENDVYEYKSLDPQSKFVYLMERRNIYDENFASLDINDADYSSEILQV